MAVRVIPAYSERLIADTLMELNAQKNNDQNNAVRRSADIVDWAERSYYITSTLKQIKFLPHQISILRYFLTRRDDGHFPASTMIYSTVKKSGKTAVGAVIGRYMAETQTKYGEIYCCGNDMGQAQDREFTDIKHSIELTPGFDRGRDMLPGRWRLRSRSMQNIVTNSRIRAVSVDAKGEAGGAPSLSIWTELWGFDTTDAIRFWEEMTPAPTIQDSMRLVETYAGFDDGSSKLLEDLYNTGRQGRQLTAGDLAEFGARDVPGQTFQELVDGWQETRGNPFVLVPVWHNEQAGILMYWDSGVVARRMPWQQGEDGERYYRERAASEPPAAFRRHHLNEWGGAESAFIPIQLWDACGRIHEVEPLVDGDRTPLVVAADAAISGDCFAIMAVSRCPNDPTAVDIRAFKKWDPGDTGGVVDFMEPEAFLRVLPKVNNVVQIAFDPYQLTDMMQRLERDFVGWVSPFQQGAERLKADSQLYDLIVQRRIHHNNQPEIREHIANANAKLQPTEDSKLRIVKKANGRKIDLTICASMASARCLYLLMENA